MIPLKLYSRSILHTNEKPALARESECSEKAVSLLPVTEVNMILAMWLQDFKADENISIRI